jgi:hypothetical protein
MMRLLQDFDAAEIKRLRGEGLDGAVVRAMSPQADERLMHVCRLLQMISEGVKEIEQAAAVAATTSC